MENRHISIKLERHISQRVIEWFCNEVVSEYPVDKVFNDIFDNQGAKFSNFLRGIATSNKRQALRFLELVERTDDIEKWLHFLEHEQKRERSVWKDRLVVEFIQKVRDWIKNSGTVCVMETKNKLQNWYGYSDVFLSPDEETILKVRALRTALYVKLKGLR